MLSIDMVIAQIIICQIITVIWCFYLLFEQLFSDRLHWKESWGKLRTLWIIFRVNYKLYVSFLSSSVHLQVLRN